MIDAFNAINFTGLASSIEALQPFQCRFPIGEIHEKDFRFCCEPVVVEIFSSYCEAHHKLCWKAPRKFSGKALK